MEQKLIVKNQEGVTVIKTQYESDKAARITMEDIEIANGYEFDMANKNASNLACVDFLEKALKQAFREGAISDADIRASLCDQVDSAKRLTNSERKLIIKLIYKLYPFHF